MFIQKQQKNICTNSGYRFDHWRISRYSENFLRQSEFWNQAFTRTDRGWGAIDKNTGQWSGMISNLIK